MANQPTIIVGKINDKELKSSIDKLVQHVDQGAKTMVKSFNDAISQMQNKLKELGNAKVDIGGVINTANQKATQSIKQRTQAQKEFNATLDQQAAAMQRASGVEVLRQYDAQIEKLKARLVEVRKDIDIFNYAIGSGKATQIPWGQEGLKRANAEAEHLMATITKLEQQRANLANVVAPQGHSIQNYVNSLMKANPELQLLNEQYKKGISLLQTQSSTARLTTEEINKQAQATNETAFSIQRQTNAERDAAAAAREHLAIVSEIARTARSEMTNGAWLMQGSRIPNAYIYAENDARAKGLTIEQQIENLLKQEAEDYNRVTQGAQQQLEAEKKVTKEVEKRTKLYKAPEITEGNFRGLLANALKTDINSIEKYSTKISSLEKYLKQLRTAYNNLTDIGRVSPFGKNLADEIQTVTRAIQRFNQMANRPVSLTNVMGLSEKTLDDIAYKMRQLSSYRSGLDVNKQTGEIKQVNAEYDRLKKKMDEVMQKNNQMLSSNNALARSWNYMKNRLAFYFTVGASTQFVRNLIQVRSEYEMNERALGILIDSAERGTQIFNELSQMALVSPYTLIELSTAAKQLTAYDVAAKDVVDTTRRLADMASAVGIPIERLTYALGQIKAYGYLNSRDARMFSNAGIPLVKQLSEYYTELEGHMVSTADVYDRIKKKTIDYSDVMKVIYSMTDEGGKFFDFQAKMADTLKVRLANLTLAWNNMLNDIGKSEQGVLTSGIGLLRDLFANWKSILSLVKNTVTALLLFKSISFFASFVKNVKAARVATKGMNFEMRAAAQRGALYNSLLKNFGERAANYARSFYQAAGGIFKGFIAFLPVMAFVSFINHIQEANEAAKQFNNTIREGAQDNYNNITKFLDDYRNIRDSLYTWSDGKDSAGNPERVKTGTKDLKEDEAKKVWEAVREQLELTTQSSDKYIGRLLQIENVSERIRQGFEILSSVQAVNAALKEIGEDAIYVQQDWSAWWNIWAAPDGLVEKIDLAKEQLKWIGTNGLNFESLQKYNQEWRRLDSSVKATAESIKNFINNNSFSGDPTKVNESFAQITNKITQENGLNPEQAYVLQVAIEKYRTEAMKEALKTQYDDKISAAKEVEDEKTRIQLEADAERLKTELETYNSTTARERVEWDRFCKYMKERHISEMQAMFGNMTTEQIKNLNLQEGKYGEFIRRVVSNYAKSHKMSYDEAFGYLRHWVQNANMWSIFIKLTISTDDGKSLFDALTGFDSAIDTADGKIKRLDKRINQLRKKTSRSKDDEDELAKALSERNEAQQEKDEAIAKGGISKADEQAAAKAARAGAAANRRAAAAARREQKAAETELQKAFNTELQLIDKVRTQYKKLTDSGVRSGDALASVTEHFENSIENINKVLGKNGLPLFDIKSFAGTDNPYALLELLNSQLKAARNGKNVKPTEIRDLEVKVSELILDVQVYNTKKIADGLNNELTKLKDDYEIALELDANPELNDIFGEMLGAYNENLPQTFGELLDKANKVAREKLKELGVDFSGFDLLTTEITPDELNKFWGLEMDSEIVKNLISQQKTFRQMFKKNIQDGEKMLDDYVKKYGDYSDKIAAIEADRQRKLKELVNQTLSPYDYLKPDYIAKLTAINQGAAREKGQIKFDEFKNSRLYISMFENLQTVSTATLTAVREKLVDLKDEMGTLSPEQLKQVIQQFEKIDKELIRRNPFKDLFKNYKEYSKAVGKDGKRWQKNFLDAEDNYKKQLMVVTALKVQLEIVKAQDENNKDRIAAISKRIGLEEEELKRLKELLEIAEKNNDQYNMARRIFKDNANAIIKLIGVIASNLQSLKEFRDYLKETFGVEMGSRIDAIVDDLAGVGEGLNKITSSAQSGDVFGVVTGSVKAVAGIGDAFASAFGDGLARTKKFTKEIEKASREIWRLNMAYNELERSVEKSLGTAETHARRLAIANKEAELAEVERQLMLEKRKRSKDEDADAIKEYQETIQDLKHEIADMKEELVTNLLGSDVKSAAEEFVDTWVQAWKAGETTLDAIGEKMNDMIYNIIKKAATSRIVSRLLQPLYDAIDEYTKDGSRGGEELTAEEIQDLSNLSERLSTDINNALGAYYGNLKTLGALPNAGKNLSALQQGIQSITEDTAGALEAYMNGVSQQVYLHSDLLTQIRDTIGTFNLDVQVATIGQILLQLQSSYQVQMAIQGIMEGWSTPNGMAVRVELNN